MEKDGSHGSVKVMKGLNRERRHVSTFDVCVVSKMIWRPSLLECGFFPQNQGFGPME